MLFVHFDDNVRSPRLERAPASESDLNVLWLLPLLQHYKLYNCVSSINTSITKNIQILPHFSTAQVHFSFILFGCGGQGKTITCSNFNPGFSVKQTAKQKIKDVIGIRYNRNYAVLNIVRSHFNSDAFLPFISFPYTFDSGAHIILVMIFVSICS